VHLVVPVTNDPIAELIERSRPRSVAFRRVLTAVNLDNQSALDAAEINYTRTDCPLSLELEPAEPPITQLKPHDPLRLRHVSAKPQCMWADRTHGAA
jgi:hypothetical protein